MTVAVWYVCARGRVYARTAVFLALCLRIIVAITNFERRDDPDARNSLYDILFNHFASGSQP